MERFAMMPSDRAATRSRPGTALLVDQQGKPDLLFSVPIVPSFLV